MYILVQEVLNNAMHTDKLQMCFYQDIRLVKCIRTATLTIKRKENDILEPTL